MDDEQRELRRLMIRDLKRSGIHRKHIPALQLKTLLPHQTDKFMNGDFGVPTYAIPYLNSHGKRTGYSRLRNLQPAKRFGAEGSHKKKKPLRYLQRANTAPHLYIPTVFAWPRNEESGKIEVDKLVITEGEKKAIKACLCGIPCVALGGVDSFKSTKRGILMLEEFEEFNLTLTDVEICYDSDLNTNADVRRAMGNLVSQLLLSDPASIATVYLDGESTDDGKQGLDDFLKQFPQTEAAEAFYKLPRKMDDRTDKLREIDRDVCYLNSVGKLYNIAKDRFYEGGQSLILDYGPKSKIVDPDNSKKLIPAAKLWLENRKEHTWCARLVYEPGQPRRFREPGNDCDSVNLWKPSEVKPIEGDVSLWLKLVRYIMQTEENFTWFMQWLAYPLQRPGSKLLQAVFVYSHAQGVGKNFVMEPLIRKIYGSNYQVVVSSEMDSDYNGWAKGKQMIFGEEIWVSDRRDREATMGKLKSLVTNEYVTVNEKYRPHELFKNYAHMYITANQSTALTLDASDRRFFVVHAPETPLPKEFYNELNDWCLRDDSAGTVLSHLLNKVDISTFRPKEAAPFTDDKDEVVEFARDTVQSLITELVTIPLAILTINGERSGQEIFSTGEIHTALNNFCRMNNRPEFKGSHDSLGRFLSNEQVLPRRRLYVVKVGKATLYALLNKKKWRRMPDEEWLLHYIKTSKVYKQRRELKINKREKAKVIDITTKKEIKPGDSST